MIWGPPHFRKPPTCRKQNMYWSKWSETGSVDRGTLTSDTSCKAEENLWDLGPWFWESPKTLDFLIDIFWLWQDDSMFKGKPLLRSTNVIHIDGGSILTLISFTKKTYLSEWPGSSRSNQPDPTVDPEFSWWLVTSIVPIEKKNLRRKVHLTWGHDWFQPKVFFFERNRKYGKVAKCLVTQRNIACNIVIACNNEIRVCGPVDVGWFCADWKMFLPLDPLSSGFGLHYHSHHSSLGLGHRNGAMLVEPPWNLHDGANPVPTGSTECLQLTHPEPVLEDDENKTRGKKVDFCDFCPVCSICKIHVYRNL